MNYKKHYDLLITRGKNRMLEGYVEKHHIVPRCMGGTDEKENLVQLTPEEHFLAHQLLIKMYPTVTGLASATQLMTIHQTEHRTNNKLFGWIRRKCASDSSTQMKKWYEENEHPKGFLGRKHNSDNIENIVRGLLKTAEESRIKIYAYNLDGTFYKEFDSITDCAEHLNTSPSNVKYTADGNFGHCRKKQLRYEFVESLPAYVNPNKAMSARKVICLHCGLKGSGPVMNRFHFDNCKYKK